MNETNWVSQGAYPTVTEADVMALRTAHRHEEKLLKKGYRWVKINDRVRVLAECDKHGKPTKLGQRQIELQKAML